MTLHCYSNGISAMRECFARFFCNTPLLCRKKGVHAAIFYIVEHVADFRRLSPTFAGISQEIHGLERFTDFAEIVRTFWRDCENIG